MEHAVGVQPSDAAGYVRLGTMKGGIVMSLRVGRYVHVHGVVSRGATAIAHGEAAETW